MFKKYRSLLLVIISIAFAIFWYYHCDPDTNFNYRWWVNDFINSFLENPSTALGTFFVSLGFLLIPIANVIILVYSWRGVLSFIGITLTIKRSRNWFLLLLYIIPIIQIGFGALVLVSGWMSI